jgi:hypothetical protein
MTTLLFKVFLMTNASFTAHPIPFLPLFDTDFYLTRFRKRVLQVKLPSLLHLRNIRIGH